MPNQKQIVENHSTLDVEDIRHFIFDRDAADNPLLLDVAYTDDEIARAMRYACLSFNEVTPYVFTIQPECMPFSMLFIHGTIYHLYLSRISELSRRDVDHTAGNMTVDVTKRLIANLTALVALHKKEFDTSAKQRKIAFNVSQAFRNFGGRGPVGGTW